MSIVATCHAASKRQHFRVGSGTNDSTWKKPYPPGNKHHIPSKPITTLFPFWWYIFPPSLDQYFEGNPPMVPNVDLQSLAGVKGAKSAGFDQHIDCGNLRCHLWLRMFNQRWGFKGDTSEISWSSVFFWMGFCFQTPCVCYKCHCKTRWSSQNTVHNPNTYIGLQMMRIEGCRPAPRK